MSLTIFLAGPVAAQHSARSVLGRHIAACHDVHAEHGIPSTPREAWIAYEAEELPSRELMDALEQYDWRLRLHRDTPAARPAPFDPFVEIADLKARLAALEQGRPYIPPLGGGALETPPYVIAAQQHPAYLFRQAAQSMLAGTGVIASGDFAVSQNSPAGMSVLVAAGTCWIPGTNAAATGFGTNAGAQTTVSNTNGGSSTSTGYPTTFTSQASYFAYNDGSVALSIASANATNPRIDLVCATVLDAEYAGTQNEAILQVVTGTAAATPAPPVPPANSLVVGSVWVPAAASSISSTDITDLRTFSRAQAVDGAGKSPLLQLTSSAQRAIAFGVSSVTFTSSALSGTTTFSTGIGRTVASAAITYGQAPTNANSMLTFGWQPTGTDSIEVACAASVGLNTTLPFSWIAIG